MKHKQIQIMLERRVFIDEDIAGEIRLLNHRGIITEACCQGPPPTALIRPSSVPFARKMKYKPKYQKDTGLFEIRLKTEIPFNKAKAWDRLMKFLEER